MLTQTPLTGINILIIEDEVDLAYSLKQELEALGATVEPPIHWMTAAIDRLSSRMEKNTVVIMDVMLPPNENNFNVIQHIKTKLDGLRRILMGSDESKIIVAREERKKILLDLENNIYPDGGINVVRDVGNSIEGGKKMLPPILFLSAFGTKTLINGGKKLCDISEWLVKPQPVSVICEMIQKLHNTKYSTKTK